MARNPRTDTRAFCRRGLVLLLSSTLGCGLLTGIGTGPAFAYPSQTSAAGDQADLLAGDAPYIAANKPEPPPSNRGDRPLDAGHVDPAATPDEPTEISADRANAAAAAKATGKAVPVPSLTTETSQTVANPDGSFTSTTYVLPVRVRRGNAWTPVDASLRANADGTLTPAAAASDLRLSGGGSGPLATMTDSSGAQLAISFPATLPAPTVVGDTATYPEVFHGVDLQVRATTLGGFSQVLIVKDAAAAANPALAALHLATTTKGLTVTADANGNLAASDSSGQAHFVAPTPRMWDAGSPPAPASTSLSATSPALASPAQVSDTRAPGAGAKTAPLAVRVAGRDLTLTIDQSVLTGPGTHYPVYIDPSWTTQTANAWTEVKEEWPTATNYNSQNINEAPGVGYCDFPPSCNGGRYRSYFQVPIDHGMWDGYNISATLYTAQVWAAYPSASNLIEVHDSGKISASTNWSNQPCNSGSTNCDIIASTTVGPTNSSDVRFNVSSAMQSAATSHWGTWTFEMAAYHEYQTAAHQRFAINPYIQTSYDKTPTTPTNTNTSPNAMAPNDPGCNQNGGYGFIGATSGGVITLTATVTSPTGHNVFGHFNIWDDDNLDSSGNAISLVGGGANGNTVPSGGTSHLDVKGFTDGHLYGWYVWADDGSHHSGYSAVCHFYVRNAPNTPTSTDTTPQATSTRTNPHDPGCDQNGGYGFISATSSGVTLNAIVSGPPDGQLLRGAFRIWDNTINGASVSTPTTAAVASGSRVSVNVGALTDGHAYGWYVRAEGPYNSDNVNDSYDASPFAPVCHFYVDRTPPSAATITSTDFPATGTIPGTGKHVGDTGCFTLSATDSYSGVAAFTYTLPDGTTGRATASGGAATLCSVKPPHWGTNTLTATAIDLAGNSSASATYRFYVPDNPTATPVPGDVSGDGVPDLLLADSNGDLRLYPTGVDPAYGGIIAATKADSPDGSGWNNYQLSHRGSTQGLRVDDLFAYKPGDTTLYIYHNNGIGRFTNDHKVALSPPPPFCDDTIQPAAYEQPDGYACSTYNADDWSSVTQILALGDINGDDKPELLVAEKDGGSDANLWLFHGIRDGLVDPVMIGHGGWLGQQLMGPGTTTPGDTLPDLWTRDSNGVIWQYPVLPTTGNIDNLDGTPDTLPTGLGDRFHIGSGVPSTTDPMATTVGDINGDGYPDLFASTTDGTLYEWNGQALSSSGYAFTNQVMVAGPGWNSRTPVSPPALRWKLDKTNDGPGNAITDSSGNGRTGTFAGTPAWTTGTDGTHAASFDGTGSGSIATIGPVLDTSASFTVTAWVKLASGGQYVTAVAQEGDRSSGFYLQYRPDVNNWVFRMNNTDTDSPPSDRASASSPITLNTWTHLAGVYDAAAGQIRLYVNGTLVATTTHTNAWNATGPFIVGRAKHNGVPTDFFNGAIADVRAYDRPLPTAEIQTLYTAQQPAA